MKIKKNYYNKSHFWPARWKCTNCHCDYCQKYFTNCSALSHMSCGWENRHGTLFVVPARQPPPVAGAHTHTHSNTHPYKRQSVAVATILATHSPPNTHSCHALSHSRSAYTVVWRRRLETF